MAHHLRFVVLLALVATLQDRAAAQVEPAAATSEAATSEAAADPASRFGPPTTIQYRVGAEVTAANGPCRDIVAMVAVPLDWPEQEVRIVNEDFSAEVREVNYRIVGGGARQMLISIPALPDGVTARAVLTVEVSTRTILPPAETEHLTIPKRVDRKLRMYTNGSPYIEMKHRNIRALSKEILDELEPTATAWEKIEAIYDKVLEKVDYVEGPDKSALEALRDGQSDCQGRSMLFIALCRANKIPARMVWVDGHAYAEFYLEHVEGQGEWYPIESAGTRAFGEMPLARPILQKGDNFSVPERKERLRYASDYLVGYPVPGSGKPKARYIRERVVQ